MKKAIVLLAVIWSPSLASAQTQPSIIQGLITSEVKPGGDLTAAQLNPILSDIVSSYVPQLGFCVSQYLFFNSSGVASCVYSAASISIGQAIGGGIDGSGLYVNGGGFLNQFLYGSGVVAALGNTAGLAGGFATYNQLGSLAFLNAAPAGTLTGATLASNVINSSLTGVGTITSGIWNGTAIGNTYLANSATTVAGQTCSLGSTCAIGYSNLSSGAPTATNSILGLVKPDGTTIANTAGAISVTYGTSASTAAQGNDSRITGALPKSGGTMTGLLTTLASASGGAGFNIPQGVAPSAPNNGDLWTTSGGVYARIAGSTIGPFGSSSVTVNTASSGNVAYYSGTSAISGEGLSALLDSSIGSTQGSVLYRGPSTWGVLTPGTSGYFLQTQGGSANPTWAAASGGSGCSTGGSAGNLLTSNGSGGCATDTLTSLINGALSLGSAGNLGSIIMGNATSGTVTIQPVTGALGSVVASLPANTGIIAETNLAQTWTAAQTLPSPVFTGTVSGAGTVPLSILATQIANTVLVNATSGAASPTAVPMPSCSTASSALQWTTSGGASAVTCNTSITAAAVPATGVSSGALGSSVTVNNANWSGTGLATGNGGTGQTSALTQYGVIYAPTTTTMASTAAGSTGQVLTGVTSSAPVFGNVPINGTTLSTGSSGVSMNLANANAYTAQQNFSPIATTGLSGTTFTWAVGSAQVNNITLTGGSSYTFAAPSGMVSGGTYVLVIKEPSTGGSASIGTWNAAYKFPGGTKPTLSYTGGTSYNDIMTCVSPDGSVLDCVFQANFQ